MLLAQKSCLTGIEIYNNDVKEYNKRIKSNLHSVYYHLNDIKNQTPELCIFAIDKEYRALEVVKIEKTMEMYLLALEKSDNALHFIDKSVPSDVYMQYCIISIEHHKTKRCIYIYEHNYFDRNRLSNKQIETLKKMVGIRYYMDKRPLVFDASIQQKFDVQKFIDLKIEEYQKFAVENVHKFPKLLKYIDKQTEEMCLAAVKENYSLLKFVKNKTVEICMAAVKNNYSALEHVEHQTPEMCLIAINENLHALSYVNTSIPSDVYMKWLSDLVMNSDLNEAAKVMYKWNSKLLSYAQIVKIKDMYAIRKLMACK